MSIKDVIKTSVYESLGVGTDLSGDKILVIFVAACLIGLYVYAVYKFTSKAAFYSKDLNITIAGMPVIIAAIMIAMQSNLIVSLGMVGALSIVRFRNAIKNPLDLLYLFWTISAGIICGVGLILLSVILCVVMTIMLLLLELVPNFKAPALLVIRSDEMVDWAEIKGILKKYTKSFKEKSRTIRKNETEIIFEIRTAKEDELLQELQQRKELKQINLLAYDGECRI